MFEEGYVITCLKTTAFKKWDEHRCLLHLDLRETINTVSNTHDCPLFSQMNCRNEDLTLPHFYRDSISLENSQKIIPIYSVWKSFIPLKVLGSINMYMLNFLVVVTHTTAQLQGWIIVLKLSVGSLALYTVPAPIKDAASIQKICF